MTSIFYKIIFLASGRCINWKLNYGYFGLKYDTRIPIHRVNRQLTSWRKRVRDVVQDRSDLEALSLNGFAKKNSNRRDIHCPYIRLAFAICQSAEANNDVVDLGPPPTET